MNLGSCILQLLNRRHTFMSSVIAGYSHTIASMISLFDFDHGDQVVVG